MNDLYGLGYGHHDPDGADCEVGKLKVSHTHASTEYLL